MGYTIARYSKLIGGIVGVLVGKLFVTVGLDDVLGVDVSNELELAVITVVTGLIVGLFPKNAE